MNNTGTPARKLAAIMKAGVIWLYSNNVFIGSWDDEFDFQEFCASRGLTVEVVPA